MNFKMPEPTATVESWTNGSYWRNYKLNWRGQADAGENLYKSSDMRAVLKKFAQEFEHRGAFKDGYSCASRLRELLEQVK